MTEKEWVTLSASGIDGVVDLVTPMLPAGSDLRQGVDHILVEIDSLNSSGGTTPGAFTYLGAVNFTPSFIGHELGHRFKAGDAFGPVGLGRLRYEHDFCVMGAMGRPDTYPDERLDDEEAPGLAATGPGMSAPTLMATGWLDPGQHNLVDDLGSTNITHGRTVALSALTGSPGMAWTGPPVAARFGDYVVEYRVATGWDRGIQVGGGARGKLIANASPTSAPVAEFVNAVDAVPGAVLTLGPDKPFDLDSAGPLVIRVLAVDAASDIIHLSFSRRAARVGAGGGVSFGTGTGGDGGGWVWTEGRGLRRIPPFSPLHDAVTLISDLAALHELAEGSPGDEPALIRQQAVETLAALQRSVRRVKAEPAPSPLQQALSGLSALEAARRRFASEAGRTALGQELLDTGAAAIDQLTPFLQAAASNERRR